MRLVDLFEHGLALGLNRKGRGGQKRSGQQEQQVNPVSLGQEFLQVSASSRDASPRNDRQNYARRPTPVSVNRDVCFLHSGGRIFQLAGVQIAREIRKEGR